MNWLKVASVDLALAVMLGAFGSHGLKRFTDDYGLQLWHTATLYLFVHALGILALGVLAHLGRAKVHKPAWILQIGVMIFSGTLYLLALGLPKWLGAITPIGGTLLIVGWLCLACCRLSD